MAYQRVEWEDYPSTETPLNADHLNAMDEGIAGNDAQLSEVAEQLLRIGNEIALANLRIDTIIALPDGATAADAEIADARIDYKNRTYSSLGESIRTVELELSHADYTYSFEDNEGDEYSTLVITRR